jgi:transcription antitermination factor NusG
MENEIICYPWYALRVRSRHEDTVATHLHARGYESFLPKYTSRRRWSDRFKEVDAPLFPGYVFCKFSPLNRLPVLSVPGVVHVVGIGKVPVAVEENEIRAIQAAVESGLQREPYPFLQIGTKLMIEEGPLAGVEGILVGMRGQERLVLSITLLQRSVAVQIDRELVRTVSTGQRASSPVAPRLSYQSSL